MKLQNLKSSWSKTAFQMSWNNTYSFYYNAHNESSIMAILRIIWGGGNLPQGGVQDYPGPKNGSNQYLGLSEYLKI